MADPPAGVALTLYGRGYCHPCDDMITALRALQGRFHMRIEVVDVPQSMKNGGGPACLRLRVALTEEELDHANRAVLFDDGLFEQLNAWVDRHYRDRLGDADLGLHHNLFGWYIFSASC